MPTGHKTPGVLATEIKMNRMVHTGAFLVVEGISDKRFWTTRRASDCEIVDGEGKDNILGGIELLDREEFSGALGIVDDDGDTLLAIKLDSKNIVVTDASDLECMLLRSSALDVVLAEYGMQDKIQNFESTEGQTVGLGLLHRGLIFGTARLAARQAHVQINSDAFAIRRFVSEETWEVDESEMMRIALRNSSPSAIRRFRLAKTALSEMDHWQIVQGHEMVKILRIGLKNRLGCIKNSIGVQEIERTLRAAISQAELETTALWQRILDWEINNDGYSILKK